MKMSKSEIAAGEALCDKIGFGATRDAETLAAALKAAVEAERKRAVGEVETLIESLNEGIMTDGDLTKADVIAMRHQLEALNLAAGAIRKGA
ncbi:MAG: hypothetical protein RLW68_00950 [Devosia marina]|uniref:hypothetical protein n=1 Tax=Devosia marina TaxID=2683198 RepID=UPI0032F09A06